MTTTMTTTTTASSDETGNVPMPAEAPRRVARGWLWFWAAAVTLMYALLWSPNWYPLSDSSLYLSLGRSFAAGRGLTMMGDPVKLTPPLAPLLAAAIMKLGGGMGTIQAVMTGLMLASHAFCFAALRRVVGERLALAATLGAAMSYWVFANAFTVMSEPPSMALMWAGVWVLASASSGERAQWGRVLGATLLFLGAAAARDAVVALTPGFLLLLPGARRPGLKLGAIFVAVGIALVGAWVMGQARRHKLPSWTWSAALLIPLAALLVAWGYRKRDRIEKWFDRLSLPLARPEAWGYLAMFGLIMGSWLLVYRYPPKVLTGVAATRPTTMPTTMASGALAAGTAEPAAEAPIDESMSGPESDDEDASPEGRYKAAWLYGVKRDARHLLTEPPMLAGRWVTEGLVMPSVAVFDAKDKLVGGLGKAVAVAAFVVSVIGLVVLVRAGHWWLLGAVVYFMVIWLQWGTRIKARYMIPIAPVLFMWLWAGLTAVATWGKAWRERRHAADTRLGWGLAVGLVALIAAGNAYPWWVEFRVRHTGDGRDFYDVARRGAFADLVDIGAWAQKNVGPHETIWMNAGAQRRIAYFLTGRRIAVKEEKAKTWSEFFGSRDANLKRAKVLRNMRKNLPAHDRFLIAYVEHPLPGVKWPDWHLPLTPDAKRPTWWILYAKDANGYWVPVKIPRADRSYVRDVPVAGR